LGIFKPDIMEKKQGVAGLMSPNKLDVAADLGVSSSPSL
jgi:hypothetical protein